MKIMKKLPALFITAALATGLLAACGQTAPASTTPRETSQETSSGETVEERVKSPEFIYDIEAAKDATQMVVVMGYGDTTAYVSMHEKADDGTWYQIMTSPGFIGKNGMDKTGEGDAKTPNGVFHFTDAFGIADDPGCSMPYHKVTEDDYWSGDNNVDYNHMVNIKEHPDLDKDASEHLIDYTSPYQYALNVSYNEDGVANMGSAIFMHCFGDVKPYTGGCISVPQDKMITVMKNVREDCVVVIDHMEAFGIENLSDVKPAV